jgi:hypothetical protein
VVVAYVGFAEQLGSSGAAQLADGLSVLAPVVFAGLGAPPGGGPEASPWTVQAHESLSPRIRVSSVTDRLTDPDEVSLTVAKPRAARAACPGRGIVPVDECDAVRRPKFRCVVVVEHHGRAVHAPVVPGRQPRMRSACALPRIVLTTRTARTSPHGTGTEGHQGAPRRVRGRASRGRTFEPGPGPGPAIGWRRDCPEVRCLSGAAQRVPRRPVLELGGRCA